MRKHWKEDRIAALELFEKGWGYKKTAKYLGIPKTSVRQWLCIYKANGKEALFMRTNRVYDVETKLKVAKSIVEDGLSVQEVMDEFKIKSPTQVHTWSRQYRSGGIDALKPKPKGRRKKQPKAYTNREEELEARVKELELELEIQKRINALAEELGQE